MRSHVAQVATRGESSPLLCRRVLQAIVAVVRVVQTADRLPVLFDQSGGIEVGIDHHGIRGGMKLAPAQEQLPYDGSDRLCLTALRYEGMALFHRS